MGTNESKSTQIEDHPRRMIQNYIIVWLDASIDKNDINYKRTMTQLHQIFAVVNTFIRVNECIDFIKINDNKQVFVISSGSLGETTVPIIHDFEQINGIFIFCRNKFQHDQWAQNWQKVKGVFTTMTPISEALKKAVDECEQNTISMSFVPTNDDETNKDLNEINQSFMYTQVLKEILLTITYKQKHVKQLINYCREYFKDNPRELKNIDKLEKEFFKHTSIWWYTYDCFLYSMLNCALRTMEIDLIIKLGFFLSYIHKGIVTLHAQQYIQTRRFQPFIVYRGQALSCQDFNQLQQSKGGLISFNNFLSTTEDYTKALNFAKKSLKDSNLFGIIFVMNINPRIKSTPFANISEYSYYKQEKEILFSMHSIFRIDKIQELDENTRLKQVYLTLTAENDPQLHALTQHIRNLTYSQTQGWYRLGKLLKHLNHYDEARHVFETLVLEETNDLQKVSIYMELGLIYKIQRNFQESKDYFEKALTSRQELFQIDNADPVSFQRSIGLMYENMGDYSKALSSYEASIAVCENENNSTNDSLLAQSYTNIADIYVKMNQYLKALSYYQKALQYKQKTISQDHFSLAPFHCNIGMMHNQLKDYSKALTHLEIALTIRQDVLSFDHPDLAVYHHNIGNIYFTMEDYSKALLHFENAVRIKRKLLPSNHLSICNLYFNIGNTLLHLKEYSQGLSYHQKVLEIKQKLLGIEHRTLAKQYDLIALIYEKLKDYSKALTFYEKAAEIGKNANPSDDILSYKAYKSMSELYEKIGDYSNAAVYKKKANDIHNKTTDIDKEIINMNEEMLHVVQIFLNYVSMSRKNHIVSDNRKVYVEQLSNAKKQLQIVKRNPYTNPSILAACYSSVSSIYYEMGKFSKALAYCKIMVEIQQQALSVNLSSLARSYSWASCIFNSMADYSQDFLLRQKAIETIIQVLNSSPSDTIMAQYYEMIVGWYIHIGEYLKAFKILEKLLPIKQKIHHSNYLSWNYFYQCAGYLYSELGEYPDALVFYQKVLKTKQKSYHSNHPELIQAYVCVGSVYDNMGDYMQALLFYKKVLAIEQSTFDSDHEAIGTSYSNLGRVYDHMGEYSLALTYHQAALDILEKALPPFHHSLATSYGDMGKLCYNMREYSKALMYCEKALQIRENMGLPYHPNIAWHCNNIGMIYEKMRNYRKAFSFYQRALNIAQDKLPVSHPDRKLYEDNHRNIKKHLYY